MESFTVERWYKRYCEALTAIDDNVGRMMAHLKENGLLENTLVIYMGDNGFQFGEHGLIDKRTAYEASVRVPLLMHYPQGIKPGTAVNEVVANIDIAPTILAAAQATSQAKLDGQSAWGTRVRYRSSLA